MTRLILFQLLLLFVAVATAAQLDNGDQKLEQDIDPVLNPETPGHEKLHDKRTIFKSKPIFRTRHVGIHPLGYRYLLNYGPMRYHYVLKRPAVTYLKPVFHTSGWKPIHKPVKPVVVPVKPLKPITPGIIHTPVAQAPTVEKPVIVPTQQGTVVPVRPVIQQAVVPQYIPQPAVVPVQPGFVQVPTTVLKPILPGPAVVPAVVPQHPVVPQTIVPQGNPILPLVGPGSFLHPLLRPFLTQFLYNLQGNVPLPALPALRPLFQPALVQPQPVAPLQPQAVVPLLPPGQQTVLQHQNHFDVVQPVKPLLQPGVVQPEGIVHHGNHLDFVKPVLQPHLDVVQPLVPPPQPLVHHGNHLDVLQPNFIQPGALFPHRNHLDIVPLNDGPAHVHLEPPVPHVHLEEGGHVHTTQHIHPEDPGVIHAESHVHPDPNLVPHVHPVHPAPQIPLYLPHHPNYKPGVPLQPIGSSSLHTELSATFPKHPLIAQHIK